MKEASKTVLELDGTEIEFEERHSVCLDIKAQGTEIIKAGPQPPNSGAIVGVLAGFDQSGRPLVSFPENRLSCLVGARSAVPLSVSQVGREVVLALEHGDFGRPIILGCIQPLGEQERSVEVKLDGEQLIFSADKEIVLRCGQSSITLTRAGKVLIRGAYLLSRSSGVNRIKGGSVQIN